MLRKLLKYELKATGRTFLPIFLTILIFAVINRSLNNIGTQTWQTPAVISMIFYIMLLVGMFIMTFVVMIQRFYKNLLSDEGYLMFTLPTLPWKHIVSKLLVSMLWIIASMIVTVISIIIIGYQPGMFADASREFAYLINQIYQYLGSSSYIFYVAIIINVILSLASSILLIYASIAIGHRFSKHKILASFGAFIVLNTLTQIVFAIFGSIPGLTALNTGLNTNDPSGIISLMHLVLVLGTIYSALICAAYFLITNYILHRRLNLE